MRDLTIRHSSRKINKRLESVWSKRLQCTEQRSFIADVQTLIHKKGLSEYDLFVLIQKVYINRETFIVWKHPNYALSLVQFCNKFLDQDHEWFSMYYVRRIREHFIKKLSFTDNFNINQITKKRKESPKILEDDY